MNFQLLKYDSLGSTNTEAAEQARRGAAEGVCILAYKQTAGRGRHGRAWHSEAGSGLYLSIIVRPRLSPHHLPLITLAAGVAVYHVLKEFGINADIKWVNDVLVGDGKISGILAETVETEQGIAVIVGVGINLSSSSFPEELAEIATSVEVETGSKPTPDEAAEAVTRYFAYFYEMLHSENGPQQIVENWRSRSSYFSGKQVRVAANNDVFEGTTDGLEPNGALRVKLADGEIRIVQAGDVTRLRSHERQ
ncbi:MAG TPA: biotin--[acetyl-CoA-carboxylase] ligase [Pyrinomonadaceae bacterium]|nr:biotin--[acetyl-CoA-carboxylase] ligase [Pyrinomonadaceae bacterium]